MHRLDIKHAGRRLGKRVGGRWSGGRWIRPEQWVETFSCAKPQSGRFARSKVVLTTRWCVVTGHGRVSLALVRQSDRVHTEHRKSERSSPQVELPGQVLEALLRIP